MFKLASNFEIGQDIKETVILKRKAGHADQTKQRTEEKAKHLSPESQTKAGSFHS